MRPDNPVLHKELRSRMRGRTAFAIPAGYAFFLSAAFLIGYGIYIAEAKFSQNTSSFYADIADFGKGVFWALSVVQFLVVSIVSVSLVTRAISGEKQQKTFDLLKNTLLRPRMVVAGKLLGCLAPVFLLVISSLPLVCVSFILGGVSPGEILAMLFISIVLALFFGSMGLLSSTLAKPRAAGGRAGTIIGGIVLVWFLLSAAPAVFFLFQGRGTGLPFAFLTQFHNCKLPLWLTIGAGMSIISFFTLVMAARRLYSKELPAFSRLQFLSLFVLCLFCTSGLYWTYTPRPWLPFSYLTLGLVAAGIPLLIRPRESLRKRGRGRLFAEGVTPWPFLFVLLGVSYIILVLSSQLAGGTWSLKMQPAVLRAYMVIMASAACYLALGELAGTFFSRRSTARRVSYVLVFCLLFLPLFGVLLRRVTGGVQPWQTIVSCSPIVGIGSLTGHRFITEFLPALSARRLWLDSTVLGVVVFALCAPWTAVRTRRMRSGEHPG